MKCFVVDVATVRGVTGLFACRSRASVVPRAEVHATAGAAVRSLGSLMVVCLYQELANNILDNTTGRSCDSSRAPTAHHDAHLVPGTACCICPKSFVKTLLSVNNVATAQS